MPKDELRILIIDDEAAIRNVLKLSLESQKYKIEEADHGQIGLEKAASFHPHVIVLDLGLPDMSGLEVLKRLREWTNIPVIILTVSDEEAVKVTLLESGANDYLTKPFSQPELIARIRVALRTSHAIEATPAISTGDLMIDLNSKLVAVRGQQVHLTSTEFELLRELAREQGRPVTIAKLLTAVWGPTAVDQSHYLRIYIAQLRKKIESDPSHPTIILTEPGVGYRLVAS